VQAANIKRAVGVAIIVAIAKVKLGTKRAAKINRKLATNCKVVSIRIVRVDGISNINCAALKITKIPGAAVNFTIKQAR